MMMAAGPLPNHDPSHQDAPGTSENTRLMLVMRRWHVKLLRILLPMAALLLAVLVVTWPKLQNRERTSFTLSPVHGESKDVDQLTMVNPRFVGLDSKQQPYTVTAKSAAQDQAGSDLIVLDQPQADIALENGAWVTVTGRKGRYTQKQQILDLEGDVNVFQDAGYEFHTERARINLASDTVTGDDPVTGHGPGGIIDAEGFMILDRGQTVIFTGNSKLHLNPGTKSLGATKKEPRPTVDDSNRRVR